MTLQSPLHSFHQELGAKFVDFGGWEMPVDYGSVISEHKTVRQGAGWFDVSHLGRFSFQGAGATAAISSLLCNDIGRIGPGQTQYSLMLNQDGGVIDDIIIWRWDEEKFWILPNAANHERVMSTFAEHAPTVALEDLRPRTVALAIQGPEAPGHIAQILGNEPTRFRLTQCEFEGEPVWLGGTGYTGEKGGEVVIPTEKAETFARQLTETGVAPVGLGARDTLRLEAGLALWGQDLDETITPIEAGLDFAVSTEHEFVGKPKIVDQIENGVDRQIVCFKLRGRGVPRHGYQLRAGHSSGAVTSGNFSPMLGVGIGMGYLSPPLPENVDLEIEIRGEWQTVEVVRPPFYRSGK